MLIGIWKNFEELEDSLSLEELNLILKAERERDERAKKFTAALKGINLDDDNKDKFEEVKKRAEARIAGTEVKETEEDEFAAFGIKMRKD